MYAGPFSGSVGVYSAPESRRRTGAAPALMEFMNSDEGGVRLRLRARRKRRMHRTTTARNTTLPTTQPAISPALSVEEDAAATVVVDWVVVDWAVGDDVCTTEVDVVEDVGSGIERVSVREVVVVKTVATCDGS